MFVSTSITIVRLIEGQTTASVLFAVASVFNINMLQSNSASDVSLENIMIMQKAEAESQFMTCVYASGECRFPDGFTVKGIKHY